MIISSSPDGSVVYSRKFPSGRKFGRAFLSSSPTFVEFKNSNISGPVVGFFTPDIYHLLQTIKSSGVDWLYGDKAYFERGRFFRITKNAYQIRPIGESNGKRFDRLGIEIQNWKRNGKYILLCPQSDPFLKFHGTSLDEWIERTTKDIQTFSDRPILVRHKSYAGTEKAFEDSLRNVYAVVVHSSIAGAQAAAHGVPCFTTELCAATEFGKMGVNEIENPNYLEDRYEKFAVLADNQWTLDEIRSGKAWRDILQKPY